MAIFAWGGKKKVSGHMKYAIVTLFDRVPFLSGTPIYGPFQDPNGALVTQFLLPRWKAESIRSLYTKKRLTRGTHIEPEIESLARLAEPTIYSPSEVKEAGP